MLELRVRIKREADGLAFLARRLPAVAHLVHLAGIDFGHLPVFVTGLVQNAALHACAGILFGLTAATCARTAVVFDTLLCKLLAALFALVFERFAIAQLIFLVGRTLENAALDHVGEELLKSHFLFFREAESATELAPYHRFVTKDCNNLFFAR